MEHYFAMHETWFVGPRQVQKIVKLIVRNWQISPKILKLLEMRHENASSSSLSNRDSASGGA
jgi:hypothetical protein